MGSVPSYLILKAAPGCRGGQITYYKLANYLFAKPVQASSLSFAGLPLRAAENYFSDRFAEKPISAPPSTTLTHGRRISSFIRRNRQNFCRADWTRKGLKTMRPPAARAGLAPIMVEIGANPVRHSPTCSAIPFPVCQRHFKLYAYDCKSKRTVRLAGVRGADPAAGGGGMLLGARCRTGRKLHMALIARRKEV